MNGVVSLIYVAGVASGLLMVAALLTRAQKVRESIVLGTLILLASIDVLSVSTDHAGYLRVLRGVLSWPLHISVLYAPLMYLFFRGRYVGEPLTFKWLVHSSYFMLFQLFAIAEYFTQSMLPWLTIHSIEEIIAFWIIVTYLVLSVHAVRFGRMHPSAPALFFSHQMVTASLFSIMGCYAFIALADVILSNSVASALELGVYFVIACCLLVMAYGFLRRAVSHSHPLRIVSKPTQLAADVLKEKYGNNRLPEFVRDSIVSELNDHMRAVQPWLKFDLTLSQLAEGIKVNPHHLSQIINSEFGKSFACFINEFRVNAACKLLEVSDNKTVIQIALESGFASKSSFNSLFKKYTGLTPSEYRKKCQNENYLVA